MAELVVFGALLLIRQHLIGLVDFLELGLGGLVVGIQIGVILFRQLTVGFLDLIVRGALGYAQDLVIISLLFRHRFVSPHLVGMDNGKLTTDHCRPGRGVGTGAPKHPRPRIVNCQL